MVHGNGIPLKVKAAQKAMFDLAESRHGLTRKILHLETGIPISNLRDWHNGAAMPVYGLALLAKIIPDYLTSLLLEPAGKGITTPEEGDGDLDTLAVEAAGYVSEYVADKADGQLDHIERARLDEKRRRLRAVA